ncbi:MAG TPA: hypothetical protein VEO54_16425 [Thermoanaerobaculia bacterium]|nr:hypothetical protein [Thermoanaerobaculia bacterium]
MASTTFASGGVHRGVTTPECVSTISDLAFALRGGGSLLLEAIRFFLFCSGDVAVFNRSFLLGIRAVCRGLRIACALYRRPLACLGNADAHLRVLDDGEAPEQRPQDQCGHRDGDPAEEAPQAGFLAHELRGVLDPPEHRRRREVRRLADDVRPADRRPLLFGIGHAEAEVDRHDRPAARGKPADLFFHRSRATGVRSGHDDQQAALPRGGRHPLRDFPSRRCAPGAEEHRELPFAEPYRQRLGIRGVFVAVGDEDVAAEKVCEHALDTRVRSS